MDLAKHKRMKTINQLTILRKTRFFLLKARGFDDEIDAKKQLATMNNAIVYILKLDAVYQLLADMKRTYAEAAKTATSDYDRGWCGSLCDDIQMLEFALKEGGANNVESYTECDSQGKG